MNIQDIYESWEQDSVFERDQLSEESIKIPQLHSKYMKILSQERMKSKVITHQYKQLYKIKHEYYRGDLDMETLQAYGWEPFNLKVLRQDLEMYIDQDDDIIDARQKMEIQKEKITLVEGIIQQINTRGFQIKNVIDWEKFKAGL
jgi:hypothetical protein